VGYFSNGTEGELYRERYCERCVHDRGEAFCPVWEAHLWFNADQHEDNAVKEFLDILIPRRPDGSNGECRMFLPEGKGG
jgi:hypothetical protein